MTLGSIGTKTKEVDISDPYLRFYLRWHVRPVSVTQGGTLVQRVIRSLRLGSGEVRTIERLVHTMKL